MQKLLDDLVADGAAGVLLHYRDGQGEWRGSSGVAELGTDRPIDPDGWFRVGSITKTFTAAVALTLVADGLLDLDATYDEWGPTVTLRQLLNHTTGIYNYTDELGDEAAIVRERYDHWDPERALRMALRHEPLFEPGTDWSYSNTNYTIVGLIIEAATGRSYAEEVRARVLEPLGLQQTIVPGDDIDLPEPHAHGYLSVDDELVDMTKLNASQAWSSGSIVSTARRPQPVLRSPAHAASCSRPPSSRRCSRLSPTAKADAATAWVSAADSLPTAPSSGATTAASSATSPAASTPPTAAASSPRPTPWREPSRTSPTT